MSTSQDHALFAKSAPSLNLPKLNNGEAQTVDVLVIGAGFTGLTAALRLSQGGKSVMVVDQSEVGGGESTYSTAQLTEFIDARYYQLIEDFGHHEARQVAQSTRVAMDWIAAQIEDLQLDCGFERVPGHLFSDNYNDIHALEMEFEAMKHCDLPAIRISAIAPEFQAKAALVLHNQMQLNPRQFLNGLARHLISNKCAIYEHTRVTEMEDGKTCLVKTEDGAAIVANDVVVATHTPICNLVFLHTKLAAYRSYVLGVSMKGAELPSGLYFDTANPYHYLRNVVIKGKPIWLVGGEDHKTGAITDTAAPYVQLEKYARSRFDLERIEYHWSGQILESVDGLPFIGKNSASEHFYVGSGYGGNGTTFGTLAGLIIADQILGRRNPWSELYRATRIKPIAGAADYVVENMDAFYRFVGDRISKQDYETVQKMPANTGGIFNIDGKNVAVYHDEFGYYFHSAVCPHLNCIVHWNSSELTWDCPCHGARFECKGQLINGPALKDLEPIDILK